MSVITATGSYANIEDFGTQMVVNASATGSDSFHQELTDLMAEGGHVYNMFHDGTSYIAFVVKKYRR